MHGALDIAKRNNNAVALSQFEWDRVGLAQMGDLGTAIEFNEGCVEISQRTKAAEAEADALFNLVYNYVEAGST